MPNCKEYNVDRTELIPADVLRQGQPGTFEFPLHPSIEKDVDLSVFNPYYRNDDTGAPAYDSGVLPK